EVLARQRQIEATRLMIAGIADAYDDDRRDEPRRLEGLDAVRDRLVEVDPATRAERLSFITGGGQDPQTVAASRAPHAPAPRVRMRTVYLDSARNDPTTLARVRRMAGDGSESRTAGTLPMWLVIVDRATAFVPLEPADPGAGGLEITSPGVVAGLHAL